MSEESSSTPPAFTMPQSPQKNLKHFGRQNSGGAPKKHSFERQYRDRGDADGIEDVPQHILQELMKPPTPPAGEPRPTYRS